MICATSEKYIIVIIIINYVIPNLSSIFFPFVDDHVVIYDSDGLHGSPRLWWTFFVLGFTRVSVLDGGLPAWRKVFPCETGAPSECEPVAIDDPFAFQPALDVSLLCSLADVERVASGDESCPLVLFDARSPGRFYGRDPEPRPVPSGHVPNAISLPYSQCLDASRTRMADTDTLRKVLTRLESEERTAVFMCGSGFTAAICVFAAYLVGLKTPLLYDGSWMEWVHSGGVVVAE